MARNRDWATEISLFESALKVCPRSLKVLNNLALRLLDDRPNGTRRALELLTTALEIDHTFPTALYNAGLAHHLLGACFGRADGWTGRFVIAT